MAAILLTADQILPTWLSEMDLMLTSLATSTYPPHTKNEITNVIFFHQFGVDDTKTDEPHTVEHV